MSGVFALHTDEERSIWVKDYVRLARQRLQDTGRWNTKKTILQNVSLLTPMEQEKLVDAMNIKILALRADRAKAEGTGGLKETKGHLIDKHRLLDALFEDKVRAGDSGRTLEDIIRERTET